MLDFILGKEIAFYVKRHRTLVVCALVLTAAASLFAVIPAFLLQPFVDEGMKAGTTPATWKIPWIAFDSGNPFDFHRTERVLVEDISPNKLLIILTFVTFISILCKSISTYLAELSAAAFSNRAIKSLRIDIFKKFIFLPLGFHQKRKSGELISRATADITVMQNLTVNILIGLIKYPVTIAVFLIYLLLMDYKLTLFVFILGPLIAGLIALFGKKVKKHATMVQNATADVTSSYHEILLCLKVVHGFFRGDYESKKFGTLADQLYKRVMRWNRWKLGTGPMLDVTVFLVLPAILILGKTHFDHTLGELMSMGYGFARAFSPIKKLAKVHNSLRTLQGATIQVFSILSTIPEIQDRPDAVALPRHRKYVEFKGVDFSYSPEDTILKDISFKVKAGEMAAFVGSTGAGKSTLLDLVPRFYDVTNGRITIDGFDIRNVTLESLRKQIGIVSQEIVLFHDTIANNIKHGRPEKGMEKIIEAAKAAHAHDFIMAQPNGYQTVIGDHGNLLSGGQKQCIAIARAIFVNPAILILDEAASALDAESEKLIQKALERLRAERTILVVAHRLSTIMKADRIYVLERGEIVEHGSREELLAIDGRFKQLYEMQYNTAKSCNAE